MYFLNNGLSAAELFMDMKGYIQIKSVSESLSSGISIFTININQPNLKKKNVKKMYMKKALMPDYTYFFGLFHYSWSDELKLPPQVDGVGTF